MLLSLGPVSSSEQITPSIISLRSLSPFFVFSPRKYLCTYSGHTAMYFYTLILFSKLTPPLTLHLSPCPIPHPAPFLNLQLSLPFQTLSVIPYMWFAQNFSLLALSLSQKWSGLHPLEESILEFIGNLVGSGPWKMH